MHCDCSEWYLSFIPTVIWSLILGSEAQALKSAGFLHTTEQILSLHLYFPYHLFLNNRFIWRKSSISIRVWWQLAGLEATFPIGCISSLIIVEMKTPSRLCSLSEHKRQKSVWIWLLCFWEQMATLLIWGSFVAYKSRDNWAKGPLCCNCLCCAQKPGEKMTLLKEHNREGEFFSFHPSVFDWYQTWYQTWYQSTTIVFPEQ